MRGNPYFSLAWEASPTLLGRRPASRHGSWSHVSAPTPTTDMAGHKQNRGTLGSLFQPGEKVSGQDFLFHPLMLPRDPGSQSKATRVSFSINPPLKGTREMAGCLGREEEGTTRGICHLLCLVGRNSGARGETATPRDPQGMGDPTAGKGGGRRATGSQHGCNQPGLPVRRPRQQTPIPGAYLTSL